ncbi:MAG TPA: pyruvate kinase alpha/beta domain-containing protein, partial [Thioalkalivibrio sp.]|nr:pyruvate kinase alpha/beta domain-containing protein [Thioalkalivibrio sp.]
PIYALTRQERTRRKLSLYRGVYPVAFEAVQGSHAETNRQVVELLISEAIVSDGDLVIITKGDLAGVMGGTNAMKIVRVGELVDSGA